MRRAVVISNVRRLSVLAASIGVLALPAGAAGQVLRVGTLHGVPGQFTSIQAAVDAARPGDDILVGPGDYKTSTVSFPSGANGDFPAAVLITTGGITLRGMNRNTVWVDGTLPGTPQCSSAASDQNYGPDVGGSGSGGYGSARAAHAASGAPSGVNGVEVYKAPNVSVENLSTCNFLGGADDAGNGVWFNGGENSGTVGGHGYYGAYLTATSTFFKDETSAAEYGVFSSNWDGGTWDDLYASNMNDSGFYIGACQQVCNQTVNDIWAEYNALGYSGSNSGGRLLVEHSQFDHNEDGFDTNSQNGDNPPPQNGACPAGVSPPVAGAPSCWVFYDNYVHDNNNPNVPAAGSAAAGPVGTGMSLSGARDDTVMDNTFADNDAWGLILVPYPDSGPPCTGGTQTGAACLYDESGDAVLDNRFSGNGGYGNPTNGDIAAVNLEPGPTDCYSGNTDGGAAASTSPSTLQQTYPTCTGQTVAPNQNDVFLQQAACDSENASLAALSSSSTCLPVGNSYPRHGAGQPMPPVPSGLDTMPQPCGGVSADPWCSGQVIDFPRCARATTTVRLSVNIGERMTGVTTRIGRHRPRRHRARGSHVRFRLFLDRHRHRTVRVAFVIHLKTRGYRETTRFTRIYHRC